MVVEESLECASSNHIENIKPRKKKNGSISSLKTSIASLESEKKILQGKLESELAKNKVAGELLKILKRQVMDHEETMAEKQAHYEKVIATLGRKEEGYDELEEAKVDVKSKNLGDTNSPPSVIPPPTTAIMMGTPTALSTASFETKNGTRTSQPEMLAVDSTIITGTESNNMASLVAASMDEKVRATQSLVCSLQESVNTLTSRCQDLETLVSNSSEKEEQLKDDLQLQAARLGQALKVAQERESQLLEAREEVERLRALVNFSDERMKEFSLLEERVGELQTLNQEKDVRIEEGNRKLEEMETRMTEIIKHLKHWSIAPDVDHLLFDRGHWVPNNQRPMCAESTCEVKFSVFHRRHHCRRCGEIFCSSHASKMAHLSVADRRFRSDGIEAKVCDLCFEATEGIHIARDLGLTM